MIILLMVLFSPTLGSPIELDTSTAITLVFIMTAAKFAETN